VIGFSSVSANLGNLLSCNDEPNDNEQERKRPEAERFNFTRADGLASFSHGTKRAVDFSSGNSEWENGGDGGVGGDGLEPSQFQYAPIVQLATVPQEVFHCAFNPVQPNMVGFVSNDGKAFVYRLLEGGSSKLLQEIRHSDRNTKCLEFSPDGGLLAVGGASKKKGAGYKGQVGLYEVAGSGNAVWTKQMMMCDEDNSIFDVSFSPCGRFVAYGGYKDVPLRVHRIRDDALTLLAEVW
jgi:WD40 repeat protein